MLVCALSWVTHGEPVVDPLQAHGTHDRLIGDTWVTHAPVLQTRRRSMGLEFWPMGLPWAFHGWSMAVYCSYMGMG